MKGSKKAILECLLLISTAGKVLADRHDLHYNRIKQDFRLHPAYDEAGVGFVECGTRIVGFESKRSAKIVGGMETPYGAYPWQVQIKKSDPESRKFEHHCGGAVVGPKTVVTAAHCFDSVNLSPRAFLV
jgi:hypothetical protein